MGIAALAIWDESVLKLRTTNLTYKDFIVKMRELFNNHRGMITEIETLVKKVDIDPAKFKVATVECIPFMSWKLFWEGTIRFSQVMSMVTNTMNRGEYVDLSTQIPPSVLTTLGITSFSFNVEGKPMYSKLEIARDSKYEMDLIGTVRSTPDWAKTDFLNVKSNLIRMLDLSNLIFWDDTCNILEITAKHILLNMKKDGSEVDMANRFYMAMLLTDFGSIMYDSMYKIMYHWLRVGTALIECRK